MGFYCVLTGYGRQIRPRGRVAIRWLGAALTFALCACSTAASTSDEAHPFLGRAEVTAFIAEMVNEHGFTADEIETQLRRAQRNKTVLSTIARPAERRLNWPEYRAIFITDQRLAQGLEFWDANAEVIAKAARTYQVDPQIIVAIIGVETSYGRNTGSFAALDALASLAFDYPPRGDFFRGELKQLFLLAREQKRDIASLKGSYAGAMGWGQFIPSSYRAYAVDFDGDGQVDIWNNVADIVGSVANYFHQHDWQAFGPVARPILLTPEQRAAIVDGKVDLHPLSELRNKGLVISDLAEQELAQVVEYDLGNGASEQWLIRKNFYVITRYNRSHQYARAAYELATQLAAARSERLAQSLLPKPVTTSTPTSAAPAAAEP